MDGNELEERFKAIDELADSGVDLSVKKDELNPKVITVEGFTGFTASVLPDLSDHYIRPRTDNDIGVQSGDSWPSSNDSVTDGGALDKIIDVEATELLKVDLENVDISDAYIKESMRAAYERKAVGELPNPVLSPLGATGEWILAEDYSYTSEAGDFTEDPLTDKVLTLTAFKDFEFDRASIPRIFWPIISKDDLSTVPALFHDLLYRCGGVLPENQVSPYATFRKPDVDYLFYRLMQKSGVKAWRCKLAYLAVKEFGSFAWQTKPPDDHDGLP